MATIGRINVDLVARTKPFRRGLADARNAAKSFAGGLGAAAGKAVGLLSAVTGVAGAAGLIMLTKNAYETVDAAGKLSDRLGISTEALTGLQHAASLAGVGNENLGKSLERLARLQGDVATGDRTAIEAFEQLGLKATEVAAMSPEKAFSKISDSIAGLSSQTQRAAAAYAIFGRQGQELLPMIQKGSEALAATAAEAEQLGTSFSRVDAAQVEAANDAITRLSSVFTGIFQQIAIQLAPFVTDLANRLIGVASSGDTMGDRVRAVLQWVATGVGHVADTLHLLEAGWHTIGSVFERVKQGILIGLAAIATATERILEHLPGATDAAIRVHMVAWELNKQAKEAGQSAAEEWQKALSAADDFIAGKNSGKVAAYFGDIKAQAKSAAEDSVKAMAQVGTGSLVNLADRQKKKTIRQGDFREAALSRVAFNGPSSGSRSQEVRDPQLLEVIRLLKNISRTAALGPVAG